MHAVVPCLNSIVRVRLIVFANPALPRQMKVTLIAIIRHDGTTYFDVRSTNSSSDHSRSVTFAAIAGVTRKVLCSRTRIVMREVERNRRLQVFKLLAECIGYALPPAARRLAGGSRSAG
jgi:hypothetical protein